MALVALSATGHSNILFPAPSSSLRHADFILLEPTGILNSKCPKRLNICWAFHRLAQQPPVAGAVLGGVAKAAGPFGRVLGGSEGLAGTPPPSEEKGEAVIPSCSEMFYPLQANVSFPELNSSLILSAKPFLF